MFRSATQSCQTNETDVHHRTALVTLELAFLCVLPVWAQRSGFHLGFVIHFIMCYLLWTMPTRFICFVCRKGLWHHICAPEVSHQPAWELCHLQTYQGRWAVGALPVLQWLLWEHVSEIKPRLYPDWGGWTAGTLHGWVQWHLSAHRWQCGFFNTGGASQCLQFWQQCCVTGMRVGIG